MRLLRLLLAAFALSIVLPDVASAQVTPPPPKPKRKSGGTTTQPPRTQPDDDDDRKPTRTPTRTPAPSRRDDDEPRRAPVRAPVEREPRDNTSKALRVHLGGAFRTGDHPYAPENTTLLGLDYEWGGVHPFSYGLGARMLAAGDDKTMFELLGVARVKFGSRTADWLPYLVFGGGLALGRLPGEGNDTAGLDLRGGGGLQYRVNNNFRIGAEVTGVYLLMFGSSDALVPEGVRDDFGYIQLALVPEIRF